MNRVVATLLISGLFSYWNNNVSAQPHYQLQKNWPQLPSDFPYSQVSAVGVDRNQNVFILQRTGRVWKDPLPDSLISVNTIFLLDKQTGKVLNSWGSGLFIMPHGLTVDYQDNVWITDVALHQIFKFNHNGDLLLTLGQPKIAGNDSSHFNKPTDVAVALDGSFYVSDGYGNSRIIKFSKDGKYLFEWGKKGTARGEFNIPHALAIDIYGNILVADRENNRIQQFDSNGKFLREWQNNQGKLLCSIAIDKYNNVYAVDDIYNDSIKGDDIILLDAELNLKYRFGRSDNTGDTSDLFHDIAVSKDGAIYVANILERKTLKFKKLSRQNNAKQAAQPRLAAMPSAGRRGPASGGIKPLLPRKFL